MDSFKLPARVPLAVVVALVAQTGAGLIWAGAADQRLAGVEQSVARQGDMPVRLARVEEQAAAIRAQLARIERKLDALGEH